MGTDQKKLELISEDLLHRLGVTVWQVSLSNMRLQKQYLAGVKRNQRRS